MSTDPVQRASDPASFLIRRLPLPYNAAKTG